MARTMLLCCHLFLLINLSYFWYVTGAKFEGENTYSAIPMSNRILEMLRERNAVLHKPSNVKPITLHKTSSSPYFNFMKNFANRQNIPISSPPKLLPAPQQHKLPYIQYTSSIPQETINGSQMLCRRLRMC